MLKFPARCLPIAVLLLAAGCSQRDPNLPDLVPVSGTITIDGKPATNTTLQFIPLGEVGTGSGGATDAEGRYQLRTAHDGMGAPVGEYKVVISKLVRSDGSDFPIDSPEGPMDAGADESLPPRYSDAEQTELRATVPEGGTDQLNFELTTR